MAASPKEFREFADECLRWADETRSDRHRQVLLDMAKTWMQAALQLERSLALIDDSPPSSKPIPRPAKYGRLSWRPRHCSRLRISLVAHQRCGSRQPHCGISVWPMTANDCLFAKATGAAEHGSGAGLRAALHRSKIAACPLSV